jgi:hypothetical protein
MQSSYLNKDFDIVEKLARRIISENKLKDKDDCFKPFCGNAGFAYLFLIYAANSKQNPDKVEQYLSEFRSVRNSYTREMWIGRDNPFHYIWNKEATEITQLMDDLGW